jgi:hypothetical protein
MKHAGLNGFVTHKPKQTGSGIIWQIAPIIGIKSWKEEALESKAI